MVFLRYSGVHSTLWLSGLAWHALCHQADAADMLYQDRQQWTPRRFCQEISLLCHTPRWLCHTCYSCSIQSLLAEASTLQTQTLTVLSFSFTLVTEIEPNLDDILRTDTLLWHSGGTVACIRPSGSLAWLSYQLGRGKCCTKIGSKSSFCSMAWCLVQCVACVVPGHHPYKPTLLSLEHTLQPWAGETEETSSKLLASQNLSHHLLSLLRPLDVLPHPEHHLLEILDRYITYWEMFSENT